MKAKFDKSILNSLKRFGNVEIIDNSSVLFNGYKIEAVRLWKGNSNAGSKYYIKHLGKYEIEECYLEMSDDTVEFYGEYFLSEIKDYETMTKDEFEKEYGFFRYVESIWATYQDRIVN